MPYIIKAGGQGKIHAAIVGGSRDGKTSLVGSAMAFEEFRPMAYIASDPNSQFLSSIKAEYRPFISVILPGFRAATPEEVTRGETLTKAGKPSNILAGVEGGPPMVKLPLKDSLQDFCTFDYAKAGFRTVVWDTVSEFAQDLLNEVGASGGGVEFGPKRHPTAATNFGDANMPDYRVTQGLIRQGIKWLSAQNVHKFMCFHLDTSDKTRQIGPATIGQADIHKIPGLFDLVLCPQVEGEGTDTAKYIVRVKTFSPMPGYKTVAGAKFNLASQVLKEDKYVVGTKENSDLAKVNLWPRVLQLIADNTK